MESRQAKKSMMFLAGEDFYHFTYSILVILDVLNCRKGSYFKDYRKLPFLLEFVGNNNLMYILRSSIDLAQTELSKHQLSRLDREYMFKSYATGTARRSEILKLLFTLERKGYVSLEKAGLQAAVNVSLNLENLPPRFLDRGIFQKEYENAQQLRTIVQRLAPLTLETMLKKLYDDRGVKTWAL